MLCCARLIDRAGTLASASSFLACPTKRANPPAPLQPRHCQPPLSLLLALCKRDVSVMLRRFFDGSSKVLRWIFEGFRCFLALFLRSLLPANCASRTPHTTAIHIIGTLPHPKLLRRFSGANASFGLESWPGGSSFDAVGHGILFDVEADFGGRRFRRGGRRGKNLHNTIDELNDSGFVNIQTGFEFLLQSRQLASQFASVCEQRPHLNECPHNKDAHLRGLGAVEHIGRHAR